jgi:NADH:ubiquinone oxidoreductase subunit F (NADH-binding)
VNAAAAEDDAAAAAPRASRRLLAGLRRDGQPVGLAAHLERHGPHDARRRSLDLIDAVRASGLRGRGGAGFPAGDKLAALAARRRRPVVVVNAVEGEPASGKDRVLLRYLPHLVLDGAVLAAAAVGAREAIVATTGAEASVVTAAIDARARTQLDGRVELRAVPVPRRFVAGEETALVRYLNGGPAKPTFTPPRPFERGVGGAPTLVQNAETVANVALIARHGPDWFRAVGTRDEPGTVLLTLSGAVACVGVYETALGSTFDDLLERAGGPTARIAAILVGGYFGSWLSPSALPGLRVLDRDLAPHDAALGARAVVVLPTGACGVVETARIARYLADESAGQCGPCVHGLDSIARALAALAHGGVDGRIDLRRWLSTVPGRGACRHPDGSTRFVASALEVFADEVELHLRGRCTGSAPATLPLPARRGRR